MNTRHPRPLAVRLGWLLLALGWLPLAGCAGKLIDNDPLRGGPALPRGDALSRASSATDASAHNPLPVLPAPANTTSVAALTTASQTLDQVPPLRIQGEGVPAIPVSSPSGAALAPPQPLSATTPPISTTPATQTAGFATTTSAPAPAYSAVAAITGNMQPTAGFTPAQIATTSITTPAAPVASAGVGTNESGTRTIEQAQMRLDALGALSSKPELLSNGEWRFACSLPYPNKEKPTLMKRYETTLAGGNGANAMWAVVDQIDQDHRP